MFNAFNRIPRLPTPVPGIVASASLSPTSVARASMAASQPQMVKLPDHIPVPTFFRKPAAVMHAAAAAEVASVAAPVVEMAPVSPIFTPPTWPDANVVRGYTTNGNAKLRFTSAKTGKCRDFCVRGIRRASTGAMDFYVFLKLDEPAVCGRDSAYLGCIFARDMNFSITKASEEEYRAEALFFGRWWDAITQCRDLDGVQVSCRESRAAERKAAREAEKAAEAAAKWNASITKAASNAGAPPTAEATAAIHMALKAVKGMDEDKATLRNAIGFSKSASYHGHALADLPKLTVEQALVGRDLVRKYRRQLDAHLVALALDEAQAA